MEEVLYIPLVPQEIWLNLYRAFEFHKEKFREIAISESIDLRFYNLLLQSFGISNNQEMTNVFIVASHGQTATKWFAKALDLHPQINCSHGYYYPPIAANDPRSDLPVAEQRRVTEERFFKRPEGLS